MNYIIIAHYDEQGIVKRDLQLVLNTLSNAGFKITLISTNLNNNHQIFLNSDIDIIVRENMGYDFYSYAMGIKKIIKNGKNVDYVFFMNSSFLIYDQSKLINFFTISASQRYKKIDMLSLTSSREIAYHCQSFLFRLNANAFNNNKVRDWWLFMQPINQRQQVIFQYELGLTQFLLSQGLSVCSIFKLSLVQKIKMMFRNYARYKKIRKWYKLNPLHFLWDDILSEYGIVKYELINKNPHALDLRKMYKK